MLEMALVICWLFVVVVTIKRARLNPSRFDNPIVLLLSPQIVAMSLIPILAYGDIVTPAVDMRAHHFLYLFTVSFVLISSIALGTVGKAKAQNNLEKHLSKNSKPFWITFFIGMIGTGLLLRNMNINSAAMFYNVIINDFNTLEDGFFNSSAAILWQANIATFFWFNTIKRPSSAMKVALAFSFLAVFARGALLYIIIATFYYVISYVYLRGRGKIPVRQFLFLLLLTQAVFILSYTFEGNLVEIYFQKTYPYLSGNFVNLYRHIDAVYSPDFQIDSFDDITQSMGLSSIRVYLDRYLGFEFDPTSRMVFYAQALNAPIYGNTHTLYGQVVYLPMFLLFPFIVVLGFMIGFIYRQASRNLFFLSIHCWLSAATFLSFAGAGHFTTTRFFPAMLFIWPLLLFFLNKRRPSHLPEVQRLGQPRHEVTDVKL